MDNSKVFRDSQCITYSRWRSTRPQFGEALRRTSTETMYCYDRVINHAAKTKQQMLNVTLEAEKHQSHGPFYSEYVQNLDYIKFL